MKRFTKTDAQSSLTIAIPAVVASTVSSIILKNETLVLSQFLALVSDS